MKEFVTLTLGEAEWTFRALDIDQLEQLEPQFELIGELTVAVGAVPPRAGLNAVAEITCESLKFKHPDITVDRCRKLLTLGTMGAVIEAIRGVSGLGEGADEGNAAAGSR